MRRKLFAAPMAALLLISGVTGCGDDGTGSGPPPNPNRASPGKYTQSPSYIPNALDDTYYLASSPWSSNASVSYLWGFQSLDVFSLYAGLKLPAQDLVVAVIDTGIDKDHEDIVGRLWVNPGEGDDSHYNNGVDDDGDGFIDDYIGWDFVHNTNNPADDAGHGSHVSGTIAAIGGNGKGIVGIAPWVRIMPLKVCDSTGACSSSDIRAALAYAVAKGAKIVNLSLGAFDQGADAQAFDAAIQDATEHGTLVFVAAGNSAVDTEQITPANATYAVAVAAQGNDGQICSFSDFGWKVDLSAPGCVNSGGIPISGILSLNSRKCGPNADQFCSSKNIGNGYTLKQGTSMSTPHAVGMAAVAWTASPNATPLQIRQALLRTAQGNAAGTRNLLNGAGEVHGTNLILEAQTAPGVKITSPRYGTSATSHNIGVRIEARAHDAHWSLRYVTNVTDQNIDLSTGTAIGTGGDVSAGTSVNSSVTFTPPATGSYLVILEAVAGGQTYHDVTLVRMP